MSTSANSGGFQFTPVNGLNDTVTYPTTPANETAARQQFMDLFWQLMNEINNPTTSGGSYQSFLRQALINGNFDVWQRGSSWTNPNNAYTADRWNTALGGTGTNPTITHSQQSLTPGDIFGANYFYRIAPGGAGSGYGADLYYFLAQLIENGTKKLCGNGKKVTVSFYARSSIANKRLGISLRQSYGTGGTPSATEDIVGTAVTLTSTWTKYTFTFPTNTLVGKTFGTNNDDWLRISFWHEWGSNFNSFFNTGAAEIFAASGTIDIAQVQVNAGDQALPFQPRSFAEELALCQRYYQILKTSGSALRTPLSSLSDGANVVIQVPLKGSMRVPPTTTLSGARGTDWVLSTISGAANTTGTLTAINTGNDYGGIYFPSGTFTSGTPYYVGLLTASGTIGFDAEL